MGTRATTLACDPAKSETGRLLSQAFTQIRDEQEVRQAFPPAVLEELEETLALDLPDRDETALPLLTIGPPGSMDLDQEVRLRGQTIYRPDVRVPLHPPRLSEESASLLPDAVRPAYLWDIRLTAAGERDRAEVYRAMVRSRRRYDYEEVRRLVDSGQAEETLLLLKEVGELRIQREVDRGGASLPMPQQELQRGPETGCEYELRLLRAGVLERDVDLQVVGVVQE